MSGASAAANDEPREDVSRPWIAGYSFAWIGLMVGLFGPIQILLPNQVVAIAPDRKESVLALVLCVGALLSLVTNPLWGALSDRTSCRYGRRRPWIFIGTVGGAAALILLGFVTRISHLLLYWCLVQTALNASWAALSAAVPDVVPRHHRGVVSGYLGLAQVLGIALAALLAVASPSGLGYLFCAIVMITCVLPFVILCTKGDLTSEHQAPWSREVFLRSFWINPARYPDFAWAWLTRFLINLGNSMALVYSLYFLRDGLLISDAERAVLVIGVANLAGIVSSVLAAGAASDRLGKRKVFVAASGSVMAVALASIAVHQTWQMVVVGAFMLGVGFGIYASVDFALITEVLPAARAWGKDMGTLNIASSLPQVLAPAIAAPIVTVMGYSALFATSAIIAMVGAALVGRIKSVE